MTDETGSSASTPVVQAAVEVPAPEVLGEVIESVTPSNLTKVLLFFVGGAICGILIGLTVATLTRETPPDFVAPPRQGGAFITGDELRNALHPEADDENEKKA